MQAGQAVVVQWESGHAEVCVLVTGTTENLLLAKPQGANRPMRLHALPDGNYARVLGPKGASVCSVCPEGDA